MLLVKGVICVTVVHDLQDSVREVGSHRVRERSLFMGLVQIGGGGINFSATKLRGGAKFQCKPSEGGGKISVHGFRGGAHFECAVVEGGGANFECA